MATSPDAIRAQLAVVTTTAGAEILSVASDAPPARQLDAAMAALRLIVPAYYDAAGSLAVAWYDELREESRPTSRFVPGVIGDPETDWIEREVAKFLEEVDREVDAQGIVDEAARLAEKEIARGYRDSILGNTRSDEDAVGWSRIARPGACKFCLMLAGKGAVYRSESTAIFAAHKSCNCAAQPKFRNGERGPEASVIQYAASSKRPRDPRALAERNARVRAYLNTHYPDAPG